MKRLQKIIKNSQEYNLITDDDLRIISDNIGVIADALNDIEVPDKVSELTNDANYVTKQYVDDQIGDIETILTNIIGHDSGETTTT